MASSSNPKPTFDPTTCPECPFSSKDKAERKCHMTASGHNGCHQCGVFVAVGNMYGHYWVDHAEFWNDHAIAWMDMCALKRVEEREMKRAEKGEGEGGRKEDGEEEKAEEGKKLALRLVRL